MLPPHAASTSRPWQELSFLARQINKAFNAQKDKEEILSSISIDTINALHIDMLSFMEKLIQMQEQEDDIDQLLGD